MARENGGHLCRAAELRREDIEFATINFRAERKRRGTFLTGDDAKAPASPRSTVITLEACHLCYDCAAFSSYNYTGAGFSCLTSKNKRTPRPEPLAPSLFGPHTRTSSTFSELGGDDWKTAHEFGEQVEVICLASFLRPRARVRQANSLL